MIQIPDTVFLLLRRTALKNGIEFERLEPYRF